MAECLFLAGASGAIGRRVAPLFVAAGWRVVGTTRSPERVRMLRELGVEPMVVDVFDAAALRGALVAARPQVVVHQLTDLPPGLDPARMAEAAQRNARIRDEGTRKLEAAAVAAGAQRMLAQSIGWAYAGGPLPHTGDAPLDTDFDGPRGVTRRGVASLERQVLQASAGCHRAAQRAALWQVPGSMPRRPPRRSTSTQRPTPPSWRWRMARRA
jgi:nucleoside-diphosphate-sugar epimerase